MEKEFQKLYESVNRLNEADNSGKVYTKNDIDDLWQHDTKKYDAWIESEERKQLYKEKDKLDREEDLYHHKTIAYGYVINYLERLQNKVTSPVVTKLPVPPKEAAEDKEVKAIIKDAIDFGKEVEDEYAKAFDAFKAKFAAKIKEKIDAAYAAVSEIDHKSAKESNAIAKKKAELINKYFGAWAEKNIKPEYTINTTSYADTDTTDWYNTDWTIDNKEEK